MRENAPAYWPNLMAIAIKNTEGNWKPPPLEATLPCAVDTPCDIGLLLPEPKVDTN